MKNFIEELIARLEEQKRREYDERDEMYNLGTDHAISEVKRLAEEYKGGWIPCSEKLPDKDMWCWATFESGNVDKIYYFASQKWWNGEISDNRVVAWMPLPEPYKTEF